MSTGIERAKEAAAERAAAEVVRGERVALGTGSTAGLAVEAIARRFPDGGELVCVASSLATETLARKRGLVVRPLEAGDRFDRMIDGADEVSDRLDLTKGRGGALFREKVLARLATRLVIVVDESKLVPRLGTRSSIPVEIVPFARPVVIRELERRGLKAVLRTVAGGDEPFHTDNRLELVDVRPPEPVETPGTLDAEIRGIPGVVETGLFVGLASRVYVGHADGSIELRDPN
ncbi:MAG: ribose 5-phosphate isomerase A [Thermoplasmata archaeon]|nr:ribose 5-phosphate isomerase A [Thermoplasmata archaeon]